MFSLSQTTTLSSGDENDGIVSPELFFVTAYGDFEKLAHGPRGTEARQSIHVYRFFPSDGSMVLVNMEGDPLEVLNPAFSRYHPRLNVVYTCTEDIEQNGQIFAYRIGSDGSLRQMGKVDAGGKSTCYLTLDRAQKNLLVVNYWDSTLTVVPLDPETGEFSGEIISKYDPKGGKDVVASAKKYGGVNHSRNDCITIQQRQADPHSHALVLDPFVGVIAYVPCLGKDVIREFYYDQQKGEIALELNIMPSGLGTGMPDGPRYLEFHPTYNVAYVVNELSSTVTVFSVDRALLNEMAAASKRNESMERFRGRSTLTLIQSINCLPQVFPTKLNTCGRICVHRSGKFVVVSNRGHESIVIFRVKNKGQHKGHLQVVGHFHTRGETPRHFKFDSSGQYLIVANQDSNSIAVFNFNLSTGEIKYTGQEYRIPSPNFVCSCPTHENDNATERLDEGSDKEILDINESDGESSDGSMVGITQYKELGTEALRSELMDARREISVLRQQLAALTHSSS